MRFQTMAPPPVFVGEVALIEPTIRRCQDSTMLGVDTETLGLLKDEEGRKYHKMTDQIVVMGLSPDEENRFLVPRKYLHHFKGLLESSVPKALTNVKFDAHRFLNTSGIHLGGPWADTVVLDFLLDEDTRENRHGLKDCAADYFDIPLLDYKELFGKEDPREFRPGHPLWDKYVDYSSLDPWVTRKLALLLLDKLSEIPVWPKDDYTLEDLYWNTEEPQLKCLFAMERRGIHVDKARLKEVESSLQAEMDETARELNRRVGQAFNPNSGPQIGEYLFETLGLPHQGLTSTGKYITNEKVLTALAKQGVDECSLILKYKKASKLKGTYAQGLLKWIHKDGRIHTSYSPTKTTGRLGSSEPNLQNVPRPDNDPHGIRGAFVPEEGKAFIVADYGQLEMRIMAYVAHTYGDDTMLDSIVAGRDMHSFTGSKMMGIPYEDFLALKNEGDEEALAIRTAAKAVGFGIIYGIGAGKLGEQLSGGTGRRVSKEEAQGYIDMYLKTFPGVKLYMNDMHRKAKKLGYVQTMCGRFRRLSAASSRNRAVQGHALRQSINAPIQGSAADIVKIAMLMTNADAYLSEELGFFLLHQVHDELIFEGPKENAEEALQIIQSYMEHPFREDLPVPLIAEPKIVMSWKEAK